MTKINLKLPELEKQRLENYAQITKKKQNRHFNTIVLSRLVKDSSMFPLWLTLHLFCGLEVTINHEE